MATYNTNNPLGSADPRDLLDNSQIADHFVSDPENESWPDRFGNVRKTWKGIEADAAAKLDQIADNASSQLAAENDSFQQFLLNSGYEPLADYVDGPITFERRNQITAYNGELYRPKASVTLPYTTTGNTATTWATDESNFVAVGDAALRQELAAQSGYALIGQVSSFADLRLLVPSYAGQRVLLSSWNESATSYGQSSFGGGEFIAVAGSTDDDGGFIAKVSDTWYWQRIKDTNLATVLDFGAIPDGATDCHDAIVAMHKWAQLKTTRFYRSIPSIQFPAGSFYFTPVDLTDAEYQHFSVKGPFTGYGYHAQTVLTSDKSASPFFKTNARTCELSGFIVEGQNADSANTQPFFDNTQGSITGGTYHRISSLWMQNFGGLLIKINDTLDTKIDQFYANSCIGGGFSVGYDNQTSGNWDHSTAIEITNFNIQDCTTVAFFNMPRCLQSLIRNGWIERSYGGIFTDGHWLVESLSVENCANYGATDFTNSRTVFMQTNQVASTIKRGYDQSTAWQTSFQPGQTEVNNYGIMTTGSQSYGWLTTPAFIRNNTATDYWYRIGKLWLNDSGDTFEIECLGDQGYNNAATESNQTYQVGRGKAVISLRKQSNYYIRGSFYSEGISGVQDVAVVGGSNVSTDIYVLVKAYSKVGLFCRANVAGSNEMTMINGTRTSTTLNWQPVLDFTSSQLTALPSGYEKIKSRWAVNALSSDNSVYGGIGVSSDGVIEERTKGTTGYTVGTTITGYVPKYVNGTLVAVPYYSLTKNS